MNHHRPFASPDAIPGKPGSVGQLLKSIYPSKRLAWLFSLLGLLGYFLQSWKDIHIQTSYVDEGAYLYLGSLFARGILRPFQDFGARSIYAPLSLLIPGYGQVLFGPGLLTGRLFSLFLGVLTLLGLWLVARRLSGNWGAALAVCVVALTPTQIMVFSAAISEVLVACMLVWALFFILVEKPSFVQIAAGSILAGSMVMTRQNMLPFLPILVGYVFWQHGKRAGIISMTAALIPILIIHAIYWPNILILWARWLPSSLTPFLDRFRPIGEPIWAGAQISIQTRLNSFFQAALLNYIPLLAALFALLLWPRRQDWKSPAHRRIFVFLTATFWLLFFVHFYVTIVSNTNDPCTYCLTPYLSFFNVAGLLLACSSILVWKSQLSKAGQFVFVILVLFYGAGLGYASFNRFGAWLLNIRFPAFQRGWNPHVWFPGFSMTEVLANKYQLDFWPARVYAGTAGGLLAALLVVGIAFCMWRALSRSKPERNYSFGYILLLLVLVAGIVISPLAGGDYRDEGTCSADIPATYQQVGERLANVIPPHSRVFWDVATAVPLLYAPEINIYPAQIYDGSSYRRAGDSQALLRMGYFNDAQILQWLEQADDIVFQPHPLASVNNAPLPIDLALYNVVQLPPLNPCDLNSYLLVYQRK